MTQITDTDIVISGGGIAGLSAAAAFGAAGFQVTCIDPTPPITDRDTDRADLRSTALLQPARTILDSAGIWDLLAPFGTELQTMRIVDATDTGDTAIQHPRIAQDFRSEDISDLPFGWNFPNWLLSRELMARLSTLHSVDFRPGVATTKLLTRTNEARVSLSDGSRLRARLVIAADGRNSPMRQAAGINVRTTRYGQKALAFAVTHELPHDNVSTEIHRSGGPFTLVPLPDYNGQPSSAVVWMEDGPRAQTLFNMDTPTFEAEMTARSCALLGTLKLASRRSIWPIISQQADRMSGERVALMAEAAHVVPPIGAQGLNMSLRDLACLLELAQKNPETLGDEAMMNAYHRARHTDISMRVTGIDLLNRTSQAANPLMQDARAQGIKALYALPPVRKMLMQIGLGVR